MEKDPWAKRQALYESDKTVQTPARSSSNVKVNSSS